MKRFILFVVLAVLTAIPTAVSASRAGTHLPEITVIEEASDDAFTISASQTYDDVQLLSDFNSNEISYKDYYGRNSLKNMENGDWLVKIYDTYAECVDELEKETLSLDDYDGTYNEFIEYFVANYTRIVDAFCNDNPSYVYYLNNYLYSDITVEAEISYSKTDKSPKALIFTPYAEGSEISYSKRRELYAKANVAEDAAEKLLEYANITDDMSDYEKAILIHDSVAHATEYHHEGAAAVSSSSSNDEISAAFAKYPNIHTMYGALVEHKAVCDGYAKTYQYLLYKVGIPSHIVTGHGGQEPHAWNILKLDGDWYYTDLTWDDQDSGLYYSYYNVTTKQLEKDHTIDETDYPFPECTATLDNYYTKNSAELSVEAVANQLNDHIFARIYAPEKTSDEIFGWFKKNINAISSNVTNTKGRNIYATSGCFGGEYHLIFAKQNGLCADKDFNLAINTDTVGDCKLLQIFYDENNLIIHTAISDFKIKSAETNIINTHPYSDIGEYSKVKYMLWNDSGSLIPICASDSVAY